MTTKHFRFRPKTNQIVTSKEQRFQPQQHNPKPMSEKMMERPTNIPQMRKPILINGVPLDNGINQPYQPRPLYSNIAPAPYNTLSTDASPNNIIESIFSQSQTPVRYSPSHIPAVPIQPQAPVNPLQALANTAQSLEGQEMLNPLQFLGGGSPLEQISKLARNLLSLPSGNQELLATMAKALSTNTAAEGSKLTSNAVIQPGSVANAIGGIADKGTALFSSAKDEETANGLFWVDALFN
jgi:hypothetical protein